LARGNRQIIGTHCMRLAIQLAMIAVKNCLLLLANESVRLTTTLLQPTRNAGKEIEDNTQGESSCQGYY